MTIHFWELQDNLRNHIRARIERGELTGIALARRAGLQQAHISNFLNQRRGLSLQSADRLLDALEIDLLDLAGTEREPKVFSGQAHPELEFVPVVSLHDEAPLANLPIRSRGESLPFRASFLRRVRPWMVSNRASWLRFVVARADTPNARSMQPRFGAGAALLIDRHYQSLHPYRGSRPNLYVVRAGRRCLIRYVMLAGDRLVLRPHNHESKMEVITVPPPKTYADFIVGRVCHAAFEV